MTVGELIKELQIWNKDLPILVENNQIADEIKEVAKDEYFYDEAAGATDKYFCDEEEDINEKRVIILIRHQ